MPKPMNWHPERWERYLNSEFNRTHSGLVELERAERHARDAEPDNSGDEDTEENYDGTSQ